MSEEALPLFRLPCSFIAGAAGLESLPAVTHPEVALVGRSNVGKSSLLNALVGQKALARTSQNPGATRQLNFFLLADQLMIVDMPGYGFAKVSKATKGEWDELIKSYLCGRPNLKRTLVLIDARRGVMKVDDAFMDLLDEAAVSYQIVLTKADALKEAELESIKNKVLESVGRHAAAHPEIVVTSSLTKLGIKDLQEQIIPFAGSL